MSTTVTTTQLCKHFGVQFKPEILIEAGIKPESRPRNGYNWNVSDVPVIGDALRTHIVVRTNSEFDLSEVSGKPKPAAKKVVSKAHDPLNDEDDDEEL